MPLAVEDYLNDCYRPEMEYVDGQLVARGEATIAQGLLQGLLVRHFQEYEDVLGFLCIPEVRAQIVERARYGVPDIMLCGVPLPTGKVVTTVPWVVVEILSPDDRMPQIMRRFQDYRGIGVRHLILLDPEGLVASRFEDGSLIQTRFTSLDLPSGVVPFDSEALFRKLVEKRNRGRE